MLTIQEFNAKFKNYSAQMCTDADTVKFVTYLQSKYPQLVEQVRADEDGYPVLLLRKRDFQQGLVLALIGPAEITLSWSTWHTHIATGGGGLYSLTDKQEQEMEELYEGVENGTVSPERLQKYQWRVAIEQLIEIAENVSKPPN